MQGICFQSEILLEKHLAVTAFVMLEAIALQGKMHLSPSLSLSLYIYMYIYMCVCVCVCVYAKQYRIQG